MSESTIAVILLLLLSYLITQRYMLHSLRSQHYYRPISTFSTWVEFFTLSCLSSQTYQQIIKK